MLEDKSRVSKLPVEWDHEVEAAGRVPGTKALVSPRWCWTGGAALMYNFGQEARSIVLDGPPWEPSVIVLAACANDTKRKSSSVH